MKWFMIFPVLLVFTLAVTPTMALAQDDPVAILKKHKAAMERGDVDAALALYADDAAIEGGGSCRWVSPCVGKAAIRSHLEQRVMNKHRKITVIADYPSGNFLTRQVEIRDKRTRKAGRYPPDPTMPVLSKPRGVARLPRLLLIKLDGTCKTIVIERRSTSGRRFFRR